LSWISDLFWLKCAVVALGSLALFALAYDVVQDRSSLPHRYSTLYIAYLERRLRSLFLQTKGVYIVAGQGLAAVGVLAASLSLGEPMLALLLLPVAFGPKIYIEKLKQRRVKHIEDKLDSFIVALSNALKTTPSIGNALAYTQPLLAPPLDDELGLTLKEMRVGTTLEQALLNMSARVQSAELDATLAGVLIGRQVGGNLPRILETTAGTLREIARLRGVVRSKTAEGKVQLLVVALAPIFLVGGFDLLSPGYFKPLGEHALGWVVVLLAIVLWVVALVIARRIVTVDI
jgi:tight adherence protein B